MKHLKKGRKKMKFEEISRDMMQFIEKSPSCYHVIENLRALFREAGYQELLEHERWRLEPGGRYVTTRNGSSLIAFSVPQGCYRGYMIAAAHSDSPTFKLKETHEMEVKGKYVSLNVEKYGGMILSPWLDRPLSVAGRVTVEREGRL